MAVALSLVYTATPLAAGMKLAIFASPQVSAGVNFVPASRYKLISVTAAAAASPANILASYIALFGALVAGSKIFIRAKTISSTGLASQVFETTIVVS